MATLFEAWPHLLPILAAVLGGIVGSFLNVVILRLPRMMEAGWRSEALTILDLPTEDRPRFSLSYPPSHCVGCGAVIHPWQNVPVVSWLLLRGRCASCKIPISVQYPLVEAFTALLSVICALHFGYGWPLAAALVMSWMLIAAAVIDLNTQLLPDDLTIPLLWMGLLVNAAGLFTTPVEAIVGAAAGYLSLWLVYQGFRLATGREGMGFGDFKLLAALGAWLGWRALPEVVLLSSVVGASVGGALIVLRRQQRGEPIPFGPFLAGAGWLTLIWGDRLRDAYFSFAGIH